jgi:SnoaL-like protein
MNAVDTNNQALIKETIIRFAQGADSDDLNAVAECLTDDAVLKLESASGAVGIKRGKLAILETMSVMARDRTTVRRHVISNVAIVEQSDTHAITKCYETVIRIDRDISIGSTGIYIDQLACTPGGWRISERYGRFDSDNLIGSAWMTG